MSMLAFLLKSSRSVVAFSVLAGVASAGAGIALIALIQAELGRAANVSTRGAVAFALLCVVAAATRSAAQVAMVRLGQQSVSRLALHLCRKILTLPLARFEAIDRGALLAALTEDIVIVANALSGIPLLCINLPLVAACLLYVGWLSPLVLGIGAAFAAAAIALYLVLASRGVRSLRAARARQGDLVTHYHSLIAGFRELKQHRARREEFVSRALQPAAETVRDRTARGLSLFALAEGWGQFAFFGFIGFVLFVLPAFHELSRATQAGVVLVVLYLNSPLDVLMTWLPMLGRARASLHKIESLFPALDVPAPEEDVTDRLLDRPPCRELRIDGLAYEYPPEPDTAGFALGPVDITLRAGEVVFLVGGNGSGKTTLVKLLSGLYPASSGRIVIDGSPVLPDELEAYRQLFTVVFADGHVFRDLFGLDRPGGDVQAREGLARLGLADRVGVDGGRFSTLDLSQGQRKRIALLTACLEDRPVCIFDEWAAHQDPRFKKFFYHEILPDLKARGKLVLVITHDEDYYDTADRVVRLHDGQLEEPAQYAGHDGYA
ncbi:MAG: cyclic peptide export ABC transporter [Isosphaeraceae bacterium]|nr:cyclic peptide export ABC transporter [Isosphaeraceae bacterium]